MITAATPGLERLTIDSLAQEIRRVDGNHSLGAGALAEALLPFILATPSPTPAGGEVRALDLSNLLRHAFLSGFEIAGGTITAGIQRWPEYNPEVCSAFERVCAALESLPASQPEVTELRQQLRAEQNNVALEKIARRDLEDAILACERGQFVTDVVANYRTVRCTIQNTRAALASLPPAEAAQAGEAEGLEYLLRTHDFNGQEWTPRPREEVPTDEQVERAMNATPYAGSEVTVGELLAPAGLGAFTIRAALKAAGPSAQQRVSEAALLDGMKPGWELSQGPATDLEGDPYKWYVHEVTGGINDREWRVIGVGDTPRAALEAALSPENGGA